jgi:hypothetical protein
MARAIRLQEFTKQQREEILKQAVTFWDRSTQVMSDFFDAVNEFERLAMGLLPQEIEDAYASYPDRSALVPPDIYNNLNSLRAHMRKVLFSKKPYFRLSHAGHPNFRDEAVIKAEQKLQQICDMEGAGSGFDSTADQVIYQALYAGITCTFLKWTEEKARLALRDKATFQLITDDNGRPIFSEEIVAEYPEEVPADIRRVRIDPRAAEVKDIRIVGYHGISQFSELVALKKAKDHYVFSEQKLWESSFQHSKYFEYASDETLKYSDKAMEEQGNFGDKPVEVYSIRGLFRFDRLGKAPEFKDLIVEVGNRSILLAVKENDLPLHGWEQFKFPRIDQQHGRIYTMGVVEPARDVFIEGFIKHNQSIDAASRNTYVTFVGDTSACHEMPQYIEQANDQLLKIDVVGAGLQSIRDAIMPLARPEIGQDTFQHSQILMSLVKQTMRMSNYLMGQAPDGDDTATGVSALVSGGQSLTEHIIWKLDDTWLSPSATDKLRYYNFFKTDEEDVIYAQDGTPYHISPGEIDFVFKAAVETSIAATHPHNVRRAVEVFPIFANDPYFDGMELRKTMLEVLDFPNRERVLRNSDHLNMVIDRENAALGYGIELPVHPLDEHSAHVEGHVEYRDYIESLGPQAVVEKLTLEAIDAHLLEHQGYIDQQQQALGNTKDMGGNTGTMVQPDSAKQNANPRHSTGQYTPQESRK